MTDSTYLKERALEKKGYPLVGEVGCQLSGIFILWIGNQRGE